MTKVVDQELLVELARDLVGAIAPEELPLFAAMSKAWFADPTRVQMNQGDDVLAFGVAEAAALLSPVLLAAATQALNYAGEQLGRDVAAASVGWLREQLRHLFHRQESGVSLDARQIAQVRAITLETARKFRIPKAKATEIADAMTARFAPTS
jgi:hypothetical protein